MKFGPEYPKIHTMFMRDEKNVIIPTEFTYDTFSYLAKNPWEWTEKIDGTNVRIHFDGEEVTIGGRTDNAKMPGGLMAHLAPLQKNLELWKDTFVGEKFEGVTLYGEGYGAGIQKGGHYRQDQAFILFDILIGGWWLQREDMLGIAAKLGVNVVPAIEDMNLLAAINRMQHNSIASNMGPTAVCEGIVGHPKCRILDGWGNRISVKLKVRDFDALREAEARGS